MMEKITVLLDKYSYTITIFSGLLKKRLVPSSLLKIGERGMLITNETLAPIYVKKILLLFKEINLNLDSLILPDGEQYKNLNILNVILTELLKRSHGRDTTLIAFGGGVIGDLTGFAASIYQRGIHFIQIPTTLLSQIDSSIGGKNSVNHHFGKNMIGSFWQPKSVLIDLDFLKTLPKRELSSGFAEVIKYGIALDYSFFIWLEENIESLFSLEKSAIFYCVRRCCKLKSKIVASDERENNNLRILLNFGHTYGHAIEAQMGYGKWLHGEAISAGMVIASRTSEYLGNFKEIETRRIVSLLRRVNLPIMGPKEMSGESYIHHMKRDKKVLKRKIRLILPVSIGNSKVFNDIPENVILSVISNFNKKETLSKVF